MAQMKPDTLRQKIDEAKRELILMDEIEHSVRALKFKDSSFAYRMWAECKAERPKTAARIERWTAMLAARDRAAGDETDSRTTLPESRGPLWQVVYDTRDV